MQRYSALLMRILFCFLIILSLIACRPETDESQLQGRILLWHSWEGQAEESLKSITKSFEDIYPDVNVITAFVEADNFKAQFELASSLAFGADLLITPSEALSDYANKGLIMPIPKEVSLGHLSENALATTKLEDAHYGLPLTLNSPVLYFNPNALLVGAEEVEEVPSDSTAEDQTDPSELVPPDVEIIREDTSTLDSLLEQASLGERVLIDTNFNQSVWGIHAFGDEIYKETGELALGEGFVAWLEWLQDSQNSQAVFLSNNSSLLLELFSTGKASYYIGDTALLTQLREALGNDLLVMPLPSATTNQAAGYLDTEALILNSMSSEKQQTLALELAKFLTNREQQRRLMRDLSRVPANQLVKIDERINPVVAVFKSQADEALPRPNTELNQLLVTRANNIYTQVLEGILSPEQALARLQDEFGPEALEEERP